MSTFIWMIIIIILYFIYFISFVFIFKWTFRYETINKITFRKSLQKKDFIHYLELSTVILLFIGIITSAISAIQILFIKKRIKKNGKY